MEIFDSLVEVLLMSMISKCKRINTQDLNGSSNQLHPLGFASIVFHYIWQTYKYNERWLKALTTCKTKIRGNMKGRMAFYWSCSFSSFSSSSSSLFSLCLPFGECFFLYRDCIAFSSPKNLHKCANRKKASVVPIIRHKMCSNRNTPIVNLIITMKCVPITK